MPTNTLAANLRISGSGSLTANETVQLASVPAVFGIGSNGFSSWEYALTNGTGSGNANEVYIGRHTITAGGGSSIDLAGSLTNPLGQTITFATIKALLIIVRSPDGTKKVLVGPQNVANTWQGPFGGTGATAYEEVYEIFLKATRYTGWTVTAGTGDLLRITNPGASDVDVDVLIIGTK
jgi:hypothetical protein